jgi:hypothetical protein
MRIFYYSFYVDEIIEFYDEKFSPMTDKYMIKISIMLVWPNKQGEMLEYQAEHRDDDKRLN